MTHALLRIAREEGGRALYGGYVYYMCAYMYLYAVNTSTLHQVLLKLANSITVLDSSVGSITLYYDSLSVCM